MLSHLQCPISSFVTTNLKTSIWSTFNASYTVLKLTRVSFLRFGVTVSLLTLNPLSTADWLWHSVSKSLNTHQRPSKFFLLWRCVYRKVSTLCVQFWNSSSLSFFATLRKLLYWSNRSSAAVLDLHFVSINFDRTSSNALVHSSVSLTILCSILVRCNFFRPTAFWCPLPSAWLVNACFAMLLNSIVLTHSLQ